MANVLYPLHGKRFISSSWQTFYILFMAKIQNVRILCKNNFQSKIFGDLITYSLFQRNQLFEPNLFHDEKS